MTGVDADTTVFVQFTINEVGLVAFRNQVPVFNFVGAHAVVLHTDHISVLFGKPVKKTLFNSLLKTIDAD